MTKIDQIAHAAAKLNDDQLDGVLAYAQLLACEPVYANVPDEVKESIERGIAERDAGLGATATDVFARLQSKIDAAGA